MVEGSVRNIVVFGGTGSVGQSFVEDFLEKSQSSANTWITENIHTSDSNHKIYLADLRPPTPLRYQKRLKKGLEEGSITYIELDIRKADDFAKLPTTCQLIANFAAVHREPGHLPYEYFDTNINGASNICNYADDTCCTRMIFTSSISPYGPCSNPTTEKSLTCPNTPYGSSKLIAEKIHETWCAEESARKLIIVRPGVLFGPGEGGNVGRMIQAIQRGMFFYCGNKHVVKAGGYLKELANTMNWALNQIDKLNQSVLLYNFSMNPPQSFGSYAEGIKKNLGSTKKIFNVPFPIIFFAGVVLSLLMKPFGMHNAFSPKRLRKLTKSNNILPAQLELLGYKYKYTLESALTDWKKSEPSDWELKHLKEIEHNSNFIDPKKP